VAVVATTAQVSGEPALPAGLLVRAPVPEIGRAFAALAALQPVRRAPEGLVCAPRAAPELAGPALARCPLPTEALAAVPGWPDPPSASVAGWYRRSPAHAPAPAGVRELIQVPGEGFGPGDHPTTAMCLAALERLPAGPAVDCGAGSGLLAQAWARLSRGPVLATDLDPRALAQAQASLAAAGLADRVTLRRGPVEALLPAELAGRVLLANLPLAAQRGLLARIDEPPRAALISGIRPGQEGELLAAYRALGLRPAGAARRGGFLCLALVGR
jgi:ribosomal protein L11 methyltransferase PrmA